MVFVVVDDGGRLDGGLGRRLMAGIAADLLTVVDSNAVWNALSNTEPVTTAL